LHRQTDAADLLFLSIEGFREHPIH